MSKRITISTLDAMKASGDKFVMITAYDATFADCQRSGAETILVGDSLGMVLQGHETTIPVSLDAMAYHTECVARARPHSLIVADLPFMSFSNSDDTYMQALDSCRLVHKWSSSKEGPGSVTVSTDWLSVASSVRALRLDPAIGQRVWRLPRSRPHAQRGQVNPR